MHVRDMGLPCVFEDCGRRALTKKRGLCEAHDEQARAGVELRPIRAVRVGPITLEWVEENLRQAAQGCREWARATTEHGYAFAREGRKGVYLHRFLWEAHNGAIPAGKVIDHMCGNRRCLNIGHLNVVSDRQNKQHRVDLHPKNKTGYRGVYQRPDGKYVAQCRTGGVTQYIGSFETDAEAGEAAKAARIEAGYYEPSL